MTRFLLQIFVLAGIAAGGAGAGSSLWIKSTIDSANAAGCRRQNVRTAALNRNALATYSYDRFFANALTVPQPNQTARQRQLLPGFRAHLLDATATLTWVPLNRDCAGAPTAVQLPVAFSARKPGKPDLTVP